MALQTKLSRSPIHQLFTAQSIGSANVVSTNSIAIQRMADEVSVCYVRLSGDPGGNANAYLVVEGRADQANADWCELGRVQLTNAAQNGAPAGSVPVFYAPEWGYAFVFPSAPEVRIATRAIGGAYGTPSGTADVYIVE